MHAIVDQGMILDLSLAGTQLQSTHNVYVHLGHATCDLKVSTQSEFLA